MDDTNRVMVERRQYRRFLAKDQTVALIESHNNSLTGHIKEISLGGLSFTVNEKTLSTNEIYALTIVLDNDNFRLDNIHFKIICHSLLDEGLSPDNEPLERFCIKFQDVSPGQLYHLEHFIKEHTNGPAH